MKAETKMPSPNGLRLEWMDASQLPGNPANWRKHPKAQADALKGVLSEVGWAGALLFNETTGRLIDGHLRKDVAKGQKVPVLVGNWTEAQEREILVTLDPLGAMAQPDMDALVKLLGQVETENPAINALLEALANGETLPLRPGLTDDDEIPERVETICKSGDLWQLGKHRLLCGDATRKEDVERLMAGEKADMVFTDPPYNQNFTGGVNRQGNKSKTSIKAPIIGDKMHKEDYWEFAFQILTLIQKYTKGGWYICYYRLMTDIWMDVLWETKANWKSIIIWKKNRPALSPLDYHNNYEPIFYGYEEHIFFGDKTQSDIWECSRPLVNDLHPTMKPVELCAMAINNSSRLNYAVLDPFGGSGSTLIACEKLNRRCYMMEIDNFYTSVIIKRWMAFTGKEAIREDGRSWTELEQEMQTANKNQNTTKLITLKTKRE